MKIVLTGAEKEAIRDMAGMFGLNMKDANKALTVETENGNTIVTVAPKFVIDYIQLVMNVAPMLKGVYEHAMGVFKAIERMGTAFDKDWSGSNETKEAE